MLPSSTFSTPFSLAALEASLRRPPPKPQVPELRLMRPQDMGIPQQMQKEMGIAPEHACDRMNQGWQERYEAIHTQMSQVYESQQALFDVENTWHDLQGHLRALGSGPDSLWPQRTAVFGASGEPENAFMRVTCEPHTPLRLLRHCACREYYSSPPRWGWSP